jgi:hypothetical protein
MYRAARAATAQGGGIIRADRIRNEGAGRASIQRGLACEQVWR